MDKILHIIKMELQGIHKFFKKNNNNNNWIKNKYILK